MQKSGGGFQPGYGECMDEIAGIRLSSDEARVLGSLMEKEATTPEYYPLSLNALKNACNQKNNREPEMQLGEDEVRLALARLERHGLAGPARGTDSRVPKYEQRSAEVFNFRRDEAALTCVLLLRGPQTPGELRGRTERLHSFDDTDAVLAGLQKLAARVPALAKQLPRQSGMKEARWAQLLTGEPEVGWEAAGEVKPRPVSQLEERVTTLEQRTAGLEEEVARLREMIAGGAAVE
jgi:uncharacterized protein YceH (UPF0502 family)